MVYVVLAFLIVGSAILFFPKAMIHLNTSALGRQFKNTTPLQPRTWYVTYYRSFGLMLILVALYGLAKSLLHF